MQENEGLKVSRLKAGFHLCEFSRANRSKGLSMRSSSKSSLQNQSNLIGSYTDYSESQISLTKTRLLLAKPRPLNLWYISGVYQFGGGAKLRLDGCGKYEVSLISKISRAIAEDLRIYA